MSIRPATWAETVADAFDSVHVLVVLDEETGQRRRRIFLRAEGAERALRRARLRGDRAAVALARLVPVELEDVTT